MSENDNDAADREWLRRDWARLDRFTPIEPVGCMCDYEGNVRSGCTHED